LYAFFEIPSLGPIDLAIDPNNLDDAFKGKGRRSKNNKKRRIP
jgi:hypothetical protein